MSWFTKDRPRQPFADVEVECSGGTGSEWDGGGLPAVAVHEQPAVSSFVVEVVDVDAERFGDRQAVQCEQARQGVIAAAPETGPNEGPAELGAVEPER